ncbi:MAG TPA: hypothetical protein VF717_06905 [Pyrinomonadaceae bacterium]|jgi:hypothetical protein
MAIALSQIDSLYRNPGKCLQFLSFQLEKAAGFIKSTDGFTPSPDIFRASAETFMASAGIFAVLADIFRA